MEHLDPLAEEIYNYCCANRLDNLVKGEPGDPRKVGCEYSKLYDQAKHHYRCMAQWYLNKLEQQPVMLGT